MAQCYFCGATITEKKIYRTSLCLKCGHELKICYHCLFYSPGSPYDCRESIEEPVQDKARANFCDYFVLGDFTSADRQKADAARKAFENLFNNGS